MKISDIRAAIAAKATVMNLAPVAVATEVKTTNHVTASNNVKATATTTKSATTRKASAKAKKNDASQDIDIEAIIAKHLRQSIDYDVIPGCGRKPVLLKAGAEHLAAILDFRTTAQVINRIEDYSQKFVLYEVEVTVFDRDGNIIATGLGSCNSRERKYLKGDFATQLNTVIKMAKKRAYVDAVLSASHASRVFTQDIDEIQNFVHAVDSENVPKIG